MCDPLHLAGFALSSASAIKAHNAQAKAYDANSKSANSAYMDEMAQMNQRQVQEEQAALQDQQNNNIEAAKALASARVGASERGVTGQSIELGFNDLIGANLRDNSTIQTNLDNSNTNMQWERKSADARRISRINSVARPSKTATGLQIASAGVDAGASYKSMNN